MIYKLLVFLPSTKCWYPREDSQIFKLVTQLKFFSSNKFKAWSNLNFSWPPPTKYSDYVCVTFIGHDALKEPQKKVCYWALLSPAHRNPVCSGKSNFCMSDL